MNNSFKIEDVIPILSEVIGSGGEFELYPRGTSMLPLIREGRDSVILTSPDSPDAGDIVLYRREGGQYVLHRIVGRDGELFTMCGDNQTKIERGIAVGQIIAKAKLLKRDGRIVDCESAEYRKWVKKWLNMTYRRVGLLRYRVAKKLGLRGGDK